MQIELYPPITVDNHSELITFLNKARECKNSISLCVDKCEYFVYYCDEGIYNIVDDKLYITEIHKNALDTPLDFSIKHKNNYIDTKLAVNYTTVKSPPKELHMSCLPFHHTVDKYTKYSLYTSKKSNNRCDVIFNERGLFNVVFFIDIPTYTPTSGVSIDTYIRECIENTRETQTNVYNETFYSLYSTIVYML